MAQVQSNSALVAYLQQLMQQNNPALAQGINPQTIQGIGLLQGMQSQAASVPQTQSPSVPTLNQALMYSNLQNQLNQNQVAPQPSIGGTLQQYLNQDANTQQADQNPPLSQDQTAEARASRFQQQRVEALKRPPSVRSNRPSDHGRGGVMGPAIQEAAEKSPEGKAITAAQRSSLEGEATDTGQDTAVGSEATYEGPRFVYNPATGRWDQPQTPSNANLAGMLGINPEQLQEPASNLETMLGKTPSNLALGGMTGVNPATLRNPNVQYIPGQNINAQVTSDLNAPNPFPAAGAGPFNPVAVGRGIPGEPGYTEGTFNAAQGWQPTGGINPVLKSFGLKDEQVQAIANTPGLSPAQQIEAAQKIAGTTRAASNTQIKAALTERNTAWGSYKTALGRAAKLQDSLTADEKDKDKARDEVNSALQKYEDADKSYQTLTTPAEEPPATTQPSSMAAPSVNQQQVNATPYQPGMKFQQGQLVQVGDRTHRVIGFDFLHNPLFSGDLSQG